MLRVFEVTWSKGVHIKINIWMLQVYTESMTPKKKILLFWNIITNPSFKVFNKEEILTESVLVKLGRFSFQVNKITKRHRAAKKIEKAILKNIPNKLNNTAPIIVINRDVKAS